MNIKNYLCLLLAASFLCSSCQQEKQKEAGETWIELFNGKDLKNWETNESPESFKVVDGMIVANGVRSHLFYVGEEKDSANFKNFEFSADVMTYPLANSGIYFHTGYQKEGWLSRGYEVQVNSTHRGAGDYKEVKKGGSLYGIRNLYKAYTKDSVWYNFNIRVQGKHVQIKIDDQLVVDYVEASNASTQTNKVLSNGTFALQGHDPESTVFFKNIKVKVLSDELDTNDSAGINTMPRILDYQSNHIAFIDYRVPASENFNIDSAMQGFYRTGINLGIVVDVANLETDKQAIALSEHVEKYKKLPVFLGVYNNNLQSLNSLSAEARKQFDYVIGDITAFTNQKGQTVDILKDDNVGDKQAFMDDYVKAITKGLDKGGLDIWASPTLLPEGLASEYNNLWTTERMNKVIDAAKRNNVAIEVCNTKKIPGINFLMLAKEKGCLFTVGGLYKDNEILEPDYFYDVIDQCKLTYKDIFISGNPN